MIAKVARRGGRLRGLLEYLYGPGRAEEHTNPHLVAAWDSDLVDAPQDRVGRGLLGTEMEAPRRLFGVEVARGAVYHVPISLHVEDGELGDEAWRRVAERTADKLGFTAREGRAGCRWIAVHHGRSVNGNDHIHFVADLVREDGTIAELGGDYYALGEMREEMEAELGLVVRTGSNRHGERGEERGEQAAAARRGRPEPDRSALARRVRAAAAGARGEAEFLTRLRRDGLLVRPRWAAGHRARRVVGYSVALRPPAGETAIWYGGGRLGRDLGLPALRQRWPDPSAEQEAAALAQWRPPRWRRDPGARVPRARALREQAWEAAGAQVAQTRRRLAAIPASDRQVWAGASREASGTLAALARRLQPGQRGELARAADALARAGQVPRGGRRGQRDPALVALSGVARVVTDAWLVGRAGVVGAATLIHEMVELATDVGRAHEAAARAAEAEAGRAAAEHALSYLHAASYPDTAAVARDPIRSARVPGFDRGLLGPPAGRTAAPGVGTGSAPRPSTPGPAGREEQRG